MTNNQKMKRYKAKEVGKMLNLGEKTVANRATYLGFKKVGAFWRLSLSQVERIKAYVPKRFINTKFSFSDDGNFLIINSKINTQEL